MADKLITVARFEDSIQASLAKQLLADFGIESVLAGWNAANAYSGLPAIAAIELQVLESKRREAQEILESHGKQED